MCIASVTLLASDIVIQNYTPVPPTLCVHTPVLREPVSWNRSYPVGVCLSEAPSTGGTTNHHPAGTGGTNQ